MLTMWNDGNYYSNNNNNKLTTSTVIMTKTLTTSVTCSAEFGW